MRRSASTGRSGSGPAGTGSRGFGGSDGARAAAPQQGGAVLGEGAAGQAGRLLLPQAAEAYFASTMIATGSLFQRGDEPELGEL